jgi:hypothetical protein
LHHGPAGVWRVSEGSHRSGGRLHLRTSRFIVHVSLSSPLLPCRPEWRCWQHPSSLCCVMASRRPRCVTASCRARYMRRAVVRPAFNASKEHGEPVCSPRHGEQSCSLHQAEPPCSLRQRTGFYSLLSQAIVLGAHGELTCSMLLNLPAASTRACALSPPRRLALAASSELSC